MEGASSGACVMFEAGESVFITDTTILGGACEGSPRGRTRRILDSARIRNALTEVSLFSSRVR